MRWRNLKFKLEDLNVKSFRLAAELKLWRIILLADFLLLTSLPKRKSISKELGTKELVNWISPELSGRNENFFLSSERARREVGLTKPIPGDLPLSGYKPVIDSLSSNGIYKII